MPTVTNKPLLRTVTVDSRLFPVTPVADAVMLVQNNKACKSTGICTIIMMLD